eukprot:m.298482 g.298482  ORF g.298482 m.298482 type:complete len:190 (+) comp15861_c1_seq3:585-1154(+)
MPMEYYVLINTSFKKQGQGKLHQQLMNRQLWHKLQHQFRTCPDQQTLACSLVDAHFVSQQTQPPPKRPNLTSSTTPPSRQRASHITNPSANASSAATTPALPTTSIMCTSPPGPSRALFKRGTAHAKVHTHHSCHTRGKRTTSTPSAMITTTATSPSTPSPSTGTALSFTPTTQRNAVKAARPTHATAV